MKTMMLGRKVALAAAIAAFTMFLAAGAAHAAIFNVGPGQTYTNIGDVPLENLAPGDTVNIYYRATPYAEKFCLSPVGTAANPVTIHGVPDGSGNLPILEGINATTRLQLDFSGDERAIIHVGATAIPNNLTATYLVIENLDIRNAHVPYTFTNDGGTTGVAYLSNAAGIRIVNGNHITIRNCTVHGCGNGIISSPTTAALTIEGCYIYGNGAVGDISIHNTYTEANGITYQWNRFGPLAGDGNALKDRSAGSIIRYNWIEDGGRQLDLVDSADATIKGSATYGKDFVYGNVLYEKTASGNSQIIHYGGDSTKRTNYRPGPLDLYNNTVISNRTGITYLVRPQDDEIVHVYNNIVYVPNGTLYVRSSSGTVSTSHNWFQSGYNLGGATEDGTNIAGAAPGFVNFGNEDFHLALGSTCINAGQALHAEALPANNVTLQYVKHQTTQARPVNGALDIGAFEY